MANETAPKVLPDQGPMIKSSDILRMEADWFKVRDILGGIDRMRAGKEKYLPRYQNEKSTVDAQGESYDPYETRRLTAPFTNIYEDISRNLAAKPFAKEMSMKQGTSPDFEKLGENLDGQGNNMQVFCQTVFRSGIDYAVTWILVDFTRAKPRDDGLPLTKGDEKDQGLRPFWVHINQERMLAVYTDWINGIEIVTHCRIYEPIIVLEGIVERTVERVRIFDRQPTGLDAALKPIGYGPVTFEIWELVIDAVTDKGAWQIIDGGFISLPYIPLVRFATGERQGSSMVFDPPLRTVMNMQITEYQLESNLDYILRMTAFPMLVGEGVIQPEKADGPLPIGPRAVLYGGVTADGTPGKWTVIEPTGTSIKALADQLAKTQNDMRDLGMQPLTQANLTVITTGQVAVKANSAVQSWTLKFKDSVEQCWKITAEWMGKTGVEPEVVIHTDFAAIMTDGKPMEALNKMRTNKDISREAIVEAAKRYDYLPSDFDPEADAKLLADEAAELGPEQPIDPRTGLPLDPATATARPGRGAPPPGQTIQ